MKKFRELQGGYPRHQDYLLNLQAELMTVADSLFGKLNHDMVLKGCDVTDHGNGTVSITEGIVFVGNEVLRFDGANNIASDGTKAFIKGAAATSTPTVFADGQTKDIYIETKVLIGDYSSLSQIKVGTNLYTLATYIEDVTSSYAIKGEIKDIYDLDGTFLDNFDGSGLGVTPRYNNWALFNGNNGTPNAQGRTRITSGTFTDPVTGEQTVFSHGALIGEVKHKLTIAELPKFKPKFRHGKSKRGTTGSEELVDRFASNYTTECDEIGGDLSHNNMQPTIAVYTIIKIA